MINITTITANERHGDNSLTLMENSNYFLLYEILLTSIQAAS